jgi:hypothetical protein
MSKLIVYRMNGGKVIYLVRYRRNMAGPLKKEGRMKSRYYSIAFLFGIISKLRVCVV